MRILILGGDGMLGHQLYRQLQLSMHHNVKVTLRQNFGKYRSYNLFNENQVYCNVDVQSFSNVKDVITDFKPEMIVNCIGLIKQHPDKENVLLNLEINAVFPHRLSELCRLNNIKIVQISTDCIFDGKKGNYTDTDLSNAEDIYGRTKFLGELQEKHTITLRTSMVGFELKNRKSLLEWIISQKGKTVEGFREAIFSGFTTQELSRIIEQVVTKGSEKYGVYNVASEPISKYDLLCLVNEAFNLDLTILENNQFKCLRHLNSSRFNQEFNYTPPSWKMMVSELAQMYKVN